MPPWSTGARGPARVLLGDQLPEGGEIRLAVEDRDEARLLQLDREIALASPPGPDGEIAPVLLAAAKIAGVDTVYRMGGAQAIAALAYGTGAVRPVNKITKPATIVVTRNATHRNTSTT